MSFLSKLFSSPMKVLLAENPNDYNNALTNIQNRAAPLQTALDAYTALGIATVPTVPELDDLQRAPRSFLVKMMTNRQPLSLVGGITISADKFYEMLDKPAGGEEFVAMVTKLFANDSGSPYLSNLVNVTDYELVAGQLRVTQQVKDVLKENSRTYATNQKQLDEWAQIQIIATALNTIRVMDRFGTTFNAPHYLGEALKSTERLDNNNPAKGNAQYVASKYLNS